VPDEEPPLVRVVIVGRADARARLREKLSDSLEVVGEADTLAQARAADVETEAWLIAADVSEDPGEIPVEQLTPRELEVLELLLVQGLSNRSIASRLAISDQTVKFHVSSIFGKLSALNRADAVRRAIRRQLVAL
jgi:ATP/maltotriose-dependent transcriptional regulator MalT